MHVFVWGIAFNTFSTTVNAFVLVLSEPESESRLISFGVLVVLSYISYILQML